MIKIIHQREKCIGCDVCVSEAPNCWEIDLEDGKSNLLGAIEKKGFWILDTTDDELEGNELAAEYCPVGIIKVQEF